LAGALEALGRRVAVNAFNLDDRTRTIEGGIRLAELGLDPARAYVFDEPWVSTSDGKLIIKVELDPWGAKMARRAWLEQAYRLGKDFAI